MTRTRWGLIAAIWYAGLCAAGQFAKVGVIIDLMRPIWPGADFLLGWVVSVVGLVGIVFGTSAGIAVARLGPRRLILGALAAGSLLSLAEVLMPPLPVMIVLRVAEGFSHLAIVVAGAVLIAQVSDPKDQPIVMTLWSTFFAVAFSGMAFLGHPLAKARGPEALFLVHSAAMALAWALLWRALPRGMAPQPAAARGGLLARHLAIYASARIGAPAMGFVFYTMMFVALITLLPGLLDPAWRTPVATILPLASILLSLTLGVPLTQSLGAVATVQIGLGLAGLAVLVFAVTGGQGLGAVLASLAISGGLGLVQGGSFAAIPQLNSGAGERAEAAGAIAQLGNVGTTLGTPVLLALIDRWGQAAIPWFTLPLCLGGIWVHHWLARRRRYETG